ncbi:Rmf/CrpP fold protein [Kitasatospora sp. P5_F3]
MGFREEGVQAMQDGIAAAAAGRSVTACPHPRGSMLRTLWVRGYAKAAPRPAED